MKEVLTAKANVDRLLVKEKEKEQQEKTQQEQGR
jgi:hypothetical protein